MDIAAHHREQFWLVQQRKPLELLWERFEELWASRFSCDHNNAETQQQPWIRLFSATQGVSTDGSVSVAGGIGAARVCSNSWRHGRKTPGAPTTESLRGITGFPRDKTSGHVMGTGLTILYLLALIYLLNYG
jgi:hypothetical protein